MSRLMLKTFTALQFALLSILCFSTSALAGPTQARSNRLSYLKETLKQAKDLKNFINLRPDTIKQIQDFEVAVNDALQEDTDANNYEPLVQMDRYYAYRPELPPPYYDLHPEILESKFSAKFQRAAALAFYIRPLIEKTKSAIDAVNMVLATSGLTASEDKLRALRTELVEVFLNEPEYRSKKAFRAELKKLEKEVADELKKLSPEAATDQIPLKLRKPILRALILPLRFFHLQADFTAEDIGAIKKVSLIFGAMGAIPGGLMGLSFTETVVNMLIGATVGGTISPSIIVVGGTYETFFAKLDRRYKKKLLSDKNRTKRLCNLLLTGPQPKLLEPIEQISDQMNSANASRPKIK